MSLSTVDPARGRASGGGPITGCDLGEVACLARPMRRDPFYRLRPPFSPEAARLSLELSGMTYTLELDPWIDAGWYDINIQIDNTLQSGLVVGSAANGERMRAAISAFKMRRAKASLKSGNPITQVVGALRQREHSDTIKAVVMMHRLPGGGYLLAIGFMGTGKRLYDWISNFRFTTQDDFHKGFLQLCSCFERSEESIVFPETAEELGLERLTLGDVLSELRSAKSRFRLWMSGHSQGAAVMQLFTHRLITDGGAQPQNIVGYGFASPTVATARARLDPAAYPLIHILNSDDVVPRIGACVHLGLCLHYQAGEDIKRATYRWSDLPADVAARDALFPYIIQMVDTPSILMHGAALLTCLVEERGEDWVNALMDSWWSVGFIDRFITFANDRAVSWTERIVAYCRQGYLAVTGRDMDTLELTLLCDNMRPMARAFPVRRLLGALFAYLGAPHHITLDGVASDGSYAYIVKRELNALRPFIWERGADGGASKRFAELAIGETPEAPEVAAVAAPSRRKPGAKRPAAARGKHSVGITAQRAKR